MSTPAQYVQTLILGIRSQLAQLESIVLKQMNIEIAGHIPSMEGICYAVATEYGLSPQELRLKTHAHRVSKPRMVAMYLCYRLNGSSYPEIARFFGGMHHTTVLHGVRNIREDRKYDSTLDSIVSNLEGRLTPKKLAASA